jgi:tetratricopeptide (TPR) repeat protein
MPDDLPDPQHRHAPRQPEPLPDSPDPVEIAMDLERHDPAPDSPARRLLINQNRLVTTQIASERLGAGLKLLTGLAGIAAAIALGVMAWSAAQTRALVVQPFSVPPELAQRGMTGEVVATRLLDGLGRLQSETVSQRAPGSYANDWGDDVQVQIPQTGVSIGELQAFLRGWLGKETNITGEVVRTPAGYAVTARTGTEPGKTFTGTEAELDTLIAKASEAVFESTQPEQYGAWLRTKNRRDDALAVFERLTISGERERRAWAFAELAIISKTPQEMLERARRAAALDPKLPLAYVAIAAAQTRLGHAEAALSAEQKVVELLEGKRARDYAPWAAVLTLKETRASIAEALGDHGGAARLYASAAEPTPDQPPVACRQCSSGAWFQAALALAQNHDPAAAQRMAARGAALLPAYGPLYQRVLAVQTAQAREDWAAALAALNDPMLQQTIKGAYPDAEQRSLRPALAAAYAGLGRGAEAQALAATTPQDCYPCVRARAKAAAAAGNTREAERWFAAAARLAPSLPTAHAEWAKARLRRGDADGALKLLRVARERGPRSAEVLKLEGDAYTRRGEHKTALARYAEAAKLAPQWGALHLAWGRALAASGEPKAARAKYAQAGRLALGPADRAALQRLLGRPGPAGGGAVGGAKAP